MLSDELRRKIENLNRGPLPPPPDERAAIRQALQKQLESVKSRGGRLFPGRVVNRARGKCYVIQRRLEEVCGWHEATLREYDRIFRGGAANIPPGALRPELEACLRADFDKLLFVDIETTGLSGGPLFLIGLLYREGSGFSVVQLLARDYSEEAALLEQAAEMSSGFEIIVSFNGSSFDLPIMRERALVHKVDYAWENSHLDLLHVARRRWRHKLPNCRLQTLEAIMCGRTRAGDIASHLIPEAYHEFVHTGNPIRMNDILHHNALDLRTMVELLVLILQNKEPYETAIW